MLWQLLGSFSDKMGFSDRAQHFEVTIIQVTILNFLQVFSQDDERGLCLNNSPSMGTGQADPVFQ